MFTKATKSLNYHRSRAFRVNDEEVGGGGKSERF